MNKIHILPDNLANQIAAGEVVERPASVIKELVENSIDAGAGRIQIDVELGGRRLMRVADDGCGMIRDDAVMAFERHATSKIRELADLGRIGTLGFRGEALASIASVARVELVTRVEAENAATFVHIEGGRLMDVKEAPRAVGTTIAVRDLFFNTPARRKFMRSEATENYHLASIVTHYALAHPELAFSLTNNGREVLNVSPASNLRERAFQIFGGSLLDSLLPVSGGRDFVAGVSGFVSAPRERRTNRDSQYFFVNQRFVKDKTIADGLREGYRSVLPHGSYPVAFLFLEVPVEEIDVNVHPAKTEIRFRRKEAVKDVIAEAVRTSLKQAGILIPERPTDTAGRPDLSEEILPGRELPPVGAVASLDRQRPPESEGAAPLNIPLDTTSAADDPPPRLFDGPGDDHISFDFEQLAEERLGKMNGLEAPAPISVFEAPSAPSPVMPPVNDAARLVRPAEVDSVSSGAVRPIAQLHESFIIAVDNEGLLLVDQHVAHERILFDKYRKKEIERPIESQNLLLPETLDLTPAQAEAFETVAPELSNLGFGVMRLSGRTIAIKSIPTDLPAGNARNLFAELLDVVEHHKKGGAKSTLRDDIAASLACKAAIKINMPLTPEKMEWLIDRLLRTSSPTTCPHGRPVILRLAMKDIERGFHRT